MTIADARPIIEDIEIEKHMNKEDIVKEAIQNAEEVFF